MTTLLNGISTISIDARFSKETYVGFDAVDNLEVCCDDDCKVSCDNCKFIAATSLFPDVFLLNVK